MKYGKYRYKTEITWTLKRRSKDISLLSRVLRSSSFKYIAYYFYRESKLLSSYREAFREEPTFKLPKKWSKDLCKWEPKGIYKQAARKAQYSKRYPTRASLSFSKVSKETKDTIFWMRKGNDKYIWKISAKWCKRNGKFF